MGDMNFLPEDYVEKRAQRRTNLISMALFFIVMGAIVSAFYWTDRQDAAVRDLRVRVDRQFEEAARRLEQLDELQQRKQEMTQKAKVTAQLLERVPRTLLLAELINRMPAELGLLDLKLETKQTTVAAAKVQTALDQAKSRQGLNKAPRPIEQVQSEVTLQIVGVAPTDVQVAQFMTNLGKSTMFNDMKLEYSVEEKVEGRVMRKFLVEMMINEEIDLHAFEPTLVKRKLKQNPMDDRIEFDGDLPPTDSDNPGVKPASGSTKE